ncbi:response regulator [Terasakiella sp. A23]|uniref:response regulator n=1 Tax=Terasakiella sp. FCG-A23 TaxID=3080561 RepID=UPI00295333BC|nr:response regulator [Terasakiella sp. A23]MDV7339704.1 response regulator [Terasakiella sp. A23]
MLPILLAEDNIINRKIIEAMVVSGGYDLHQVENGRDALHAVEEEDYLCVLMDLHMPEMDGIEATRQIRALSSTKRAIPIIAVTANVLDSVRDEAMEAGMNEFLSKPVSCQILLDAIQRNIID